MDQLIQQFRQAEDYFFKGISIKHLDIASEAVAYMTGVQVADLNLVYIYNQVTALEKILNQSKDFYDQDKLPFIVLIPEDYCSMEIEKIFKTLGYERKETSVAMTLQLNDFIVKNQMNLDESMEIKQNNNHLDQWMVPLISAFGSTFNVTEQYAKTHEQALKENIRLQHFSLYQNNKPIASMTLSLNNKIARIDDVGTLPEFQGRGYATKLMQYALLEAKKLGATDCFLEASESGLSIYQQLGFKPIFKNYIYAR